MAANEKQIGIRLKSPALDIIERRTEYINRLAPEVKTTTGAVARHAVEEYAKMLDRSAVETRLVMPFIDWYTQYAYEPSLAINLEDHPFLQEKDLKVDYEHDVEVLEKLHSHFKGITEILKKYNYLEQSQLSAWEGITGSLYATYTHLASGFAHADEQYAREQAELAAVEYDMELAQESEGQNGFDYDWSNFKYYEEERAEGGWQTNAVVEITVPERDAAFGVILYLQNGERYGKVVDYRYYPIPDGDNKLTIDEYNGVSQHFIDHCSVSIAEEYRNKGL